MFAFEATFNAPARSNRAPMLADFLRFNARQSKHYDLGIAGEKLAIAMLEDAGFKAWKPKESHCGDVLAVDRHTGESFSIEVKTANKSESRNSWQFCLNKAKHTSISHSAYILLICIAEKRVFTYLIPSDFLSGLSQFCITSHPEKYRGKVAPFRNRGVLSFDTTNEVYNLARLQ